ncbi:hypothetical protein XELAEV_18003145mg [Xenopus laevis]|nr:hypothetical protein XELAEV_18003145mg [Xenopus laevis]
MSTRKLDKFDENMSVFETPQSVCQWCAVLGLNPRKVAGEGPMVPRVKEEYIYQILDGEQMFYHPRVAASWRDSAEVLLNVLDRPREIGRDQVHPEIDAEREGPWKSVLPDMSNDADGFISHGDALTTQYAVKAEESVPLNKTFVVSKGSLQSSGGRLDTPEIVSALGQLTDQLTQLAWNGNFKRLKVFSVTNPAPADEESFESWRLHCCVCDLIEVLEVTFGPVESATEMLYRFHSTFQKEKEDLSAYLVWLEQGLRLLVSHSAITGDEIDSLRIRQLKRGTLNSDPIAMTIRAHYQDKLPPGYVGLMESVWREEADA